MQQIPKPPESELTPHFGLRIVFRDGFRRIGEPRLTARRTALDNPANLGARACNGIASESLARSHLTLLVADYRFRLAASPEAHHELGHGLVHGRIRTEAPTGGPGGLHYQRALVPHHRRRHGPALLRGPVLLSLRLRCA